jgi:hypothetical protein
MIELIALAEKYSVTTPPYHQVLPQSLAEKANVTSIMNSMPKDLKWSVEEDFWLDWAQNKLNFDGNHHTVHLAPFRIRVCAIVAYAYNNLNISGEFT